MFEPPYGERLWFYSAPDRAATAIRDWQIKRRKGNLRNLRFLFLFIFTGSGGLARYLAFKLSPSISESICRLSWRSLSKGGMIERRKLMCFVILPQTYIKKKKKCGAFVKINVTNDCPMTLE